MLWAFSSNNPFFSKFFKFTNDEFFNPVNLNDKNGFKVTVNGYAECIHYVDGGYINNQSFSSEDRTPFLNNIFLYIIFTASSFYTLYYNTANFC